MKIALKKKYLGGLASFITLMLGYSLAQELFFQLSQKPLSILIAPLIFIILTVYTISFWRSLWLKEKLADKCAKKAADGDCQMETQVKDHLWNKSWEEAFTINYFLGRVVFTSSWVDQDEIEKIRTSTMPDIVKIELLRRKK